MIVLHILDQKGRDVATTGANVPLRDIAKIISERRIGALVVTGNDGAILGIVSERDVVRAVATGRGDALSDPVSQHMTADVVCCAPDDHVHSVLERMTEGKFRHMPVRADGKLAGIVSIGDMVKAKLEEMASESRALRDYISAS